MVRQSDRTRWTRDVAAPMRTFLRTESASSGLLVASIVAAVLWATLVPHSYDAVWHTHVEVRAGELRIDRELRSWINDGLMTLFFLVIGLEARRELDLGELRDKRRAVLPLAAGLLGMAVPGLIFVAINAGEASARGWGVAISTDTALAMGLLALVGRGFPAQMRAMLLTYFIVDDIAALVVVVGFYSHDLRPVPLLVAVTVFGSLVGLQGAGYVRTPVFVALGIVVWAALLSSGIDPVVAGLAVGLLAAAYTPSRADLEQASGLFRLFREQPTPELARSATTGLASTLSLNARLQRTLHPWTAFAIVPLFALANAGVSLRPDLLSHAWSAPVTVGVFLAYVVGKPIGVIGASWLVARGSHGRLRPAVGWASVGAAGTLAGIGFTVSLLVASIAFQDRQLEEAKLGLLSAVLVASLLTYTVLRVTAALPAGARARALLGSGDGLVDLATPVDPERDHVRGPEDAAVTIVEYGDFQCPYCGRAESAVASLLLESDVRFVWRHLPLTDVHAQAQLASEAAEAAAAQGKFWPMHDRLHGAGEDRLSLRDLTQYAAELGLDVDRFREDLVRQTHAARVAQDVESADLSGVSGTPTFFVNGRRHYGAYDRHALMDAISTARSRARLAVAGHPPTSTPEARRAGTGTGP